MRRSGAYFNNPNVECGARAILAATPVSGSRRQISASTHKAAVPRK
jgi:hypothetical protein